MHFCIDRIYLFNSTRQQRFRTFHFESMNFEGNRLDVVGYYVIGVVCENAENIARKRRTFVRVEIKIFLSLFGLLWIRTVHSFELLVNPFPSKPLFSRVCSTSLLKTLWEKEKLLTTSNFSFSLSVFYPFGELSTILIKFEIDVCKLLQFGRIKNNVVWQRVR